MVDQNGTKLLRLAFAPDKLLSLTKEKDNALNALMTSPSGTEKHVLPALNTPTMMLSQRPALSAQKDFNTTPHRGHAQLSMLDHYSKIWYLILFLSIR